MHAFHWGGELKEISRVNWSKGGGCEHEGSGFMGWGQDGGRKSIERDILM